MHNYQLNTRSCHDPNCDYGRQSLTLAMQNFSTWTSFSQISIEMGWEMGNIFGMYVLFTGLGRSVLGETARGLEYHPKFVNSFVFV